MSDWVYEQYLSGLKSNRSKYIEEMLVKGVTSEMGELENIRTKQIEILKELRSKEEENKKLQLLVGSLKQKLGDDYDPKRKELERFADGIKANNPLRDEE